MVEEFLGLVAFEDLPKEIDLKNPDVARQVYRCVEDGLKQLVKGQSIAIEAKDSDGELVNFNVKVAQAQFESASL